MKNETQDQLQQKKPVYPGNTHALKIIVAVLAALIAGAVFLYVSRSMDIERRNYNKALLEEYRDEYSPKVKSIIAAVSTDEMIGQIRELIREEEEAFEQAKLKAREYYACLPEDIKERQKRFVNDNEAFGFFYSAINKIMHDLENDPSFDARKKKQEFDAIRFYAELYGHKAQITYLENLIFDIKRREQNQ
jgi:hypothetical protein